MEMSTDEKELYQKIRQVMAEREAIGELERGDVSDEDIFNLLSSNDDDLPTLGLDILSLLPTVPDAKLFGDGKNEKDQRAAGNFLRFFFALEAEGKINHELQGKTDKLKSQIEKLLLLSDLRNQYYQSQKNSNEGKSSTDLTGKTLTIIVHGTWSNPPADWWINGRPWWWEHKGDFWEYLNTKTSGVYGGSDYFQWTGKNSDQARMQAASKLVSWCQKKTYQRLQIIAHSHGGNVAMYASRLGLKIDNLILLGTPIRVNYIPDFSNIQRLINVFSTGDIIQQPGTFPHRRNEGRTLADSSTVLNVQAVDNSNGSNPGHGALHEPKIWQASGLYKFLL